MAFKKAYELPIHESHDPMVNLATYPFVLEPRYFESGLSDTSDMWIRKQVADRLADLQQNELGELTFKIWDAWRPRSVQQNLYDDCRAQLKKGHPEWSDQDLDQELIKFVALPNNPDRVPPHSTGGAIDLTLSSTDGAELDMGTDFDHFGPESAVDYYDSDSANSDAAENRKFLQAVMAKGGFAHHIDEWWHFDFGNQRWALHTNKDAALYGEIIHPEEFNRAIAKETNYAIS